MPPTEMSRSELLCCRAAASLRSSSVPPAATHACAITTVRFMPRAAASARMRAAASPSTVAWLRCRGGSCPAPGPAARPAAAAAVSSGRPRAGSRYGTPYTATGPCSSVSTTGSASRARLVRRWTPAVSISALLTPSRSAESWLPLIRITRAAEPGERVLAERDRVHRRDGPVVDVARDEDGVHALGARGLDEVVEERRLRFSQVGPVERPPEMPVRGMQEPHGRDSSEPGRHSGPELGLRAALDASRRCAMTTTARETAPVGGPAEVQDAGHVDVLIIGAGVSGIGVAHHLRDQFPDRTFVILDAQDNRGGTWWTHRYPGVRSDSDLFTYGYRFKPWRGPAIAAGGEILAYLDEVIDDDALGRHIRLRHQVTAASWSTEERRWTVEVIRGDTGQQLRFTAGFLWMCPGYYNHAKPYRPQWEGTDRFQGAIVHPQNWPDDLDLAGRRVVVIGSGATAATLIPAIAEKAEHVTMVQRSPSYFFAPPTTHELAITLRALDIPEEW